MQGIIPAAFNYHKQGTGLRWRCFIFHCGDNDNDNDDVGAAGGAGAGMMGRMKRRSRIRGNGTQWAAAQKLPKRVIVRGGPSRSGASRLCCLSALGP